MPHSPKKVFVTSRLFAGYSGTLDAGVLARLIAALPQGAPGATAAHKRYDAAACAVEIPADVGFCALGHNLYALGSSYSGACPVLSSLVSYGYLWNMVRVQGGAYGTGMNVRRSGDIFCYSYRDPNLDNTRAVFSNVADFIQGFRGAGHAARRHYHRPGQYDRSLARSRRCVREPVRARAQGCNAGGAGQDPA